MELVPSKTPSPGPSVSASAAEIQQHPLLKAHPNFAQAYSEFKSFLKAAEEDLKMKSDSLRFQRKSIVQGHRGIKHYLDCQIFMLSRHSRRLEQFSSETNLRLSLICERYKNMQEQEEEKTDDSLNGSCSDNSSSGGGISIVGTADKGLVNCDLLQLLADMGKMKRRCKHILDVTDRYCVLTPEDLRMKEAAAAATPVASPSMNLDSVGDEDPDDIMNRVAEDNKMPSSPHAGHLLPSQITQNIVKSTFESFGNHLAVIAKTYTRKKAAGDYSTASV